MNEIVEELERHSINDTRYDIVGVYHNCDALIEKKRKEIKKITMISNIVFWIWSIITVILIFVTQVTKKLQWEILKFLAFSQIVILIVSVLKMRNAIRATNSIVPKDGLV